jgi:hypothetical protein
MEEEKMLKHVVFMRFKKDASDAAIADLEAGLRGLPAAIPEIREYQFGRDILRTERSYDFGLVSAFDDLDSMKRYQVAPPHLVVLDKVKKLTESIVVVDFEF